MFFTVLTLFLYRSNNLLSSLLILEITSFMTIYLLSFVVVPSEFILILSFSIFVIDGVIGLSGLILLVSYTGTDYLSSQSFINV